MSHERLSNDEVLRIALDAISGNRMAEAIDLLKILLERDPKHMFATYLLAAEHAQLGMLDEAESGFRRAVELAPDFDIARLQWGQLFFSKGDAEATKRTLQPLVAKDAGDAICYYARGLMAAAEEDVALALSEIQRGLACVQEIPALAADMGQVARQLEGLLQSDRATPELSPTTPVPVHLTRYGQSGG